MPRGEIVASSEWKVQKPLANRSLETPRESSVNVVRLLIQNLGEAPAWARRRERFRGRSLWPAKE